MYIEYIYILYTHSVFRENINRFYVEIEKCLNSILDVLGQIKHLISSALFTLLNMASRKSRLHIWILFLLDSTALRLTPNTVSHPNEYA